MAPLLLAQAQPAASAPARTPGLLDSPMLPLILIAVVMWLIWFRPKSAEQKKVKDMLANIKKGDRVMTIGGVLGTVVNIKDDEVTLKVDESTNTKMTFIRGAIKTVLGGETPSKPNP